MLQHAQAIVAPDVIDNYDADRFMNKVGQPSSKSEYRIYAVRMHIMIHSIHYEQP